MIKVVGIRFQRAGKIYYFDPLDYDLETAMHVIVETARGVEMGTVLIPPKEVDDDKVVQPLKPVIRMFLHLRPLLTRLTMFPLPVSKR